MDVKKSLNSEVYEIDEEGGVQPEDLELEVEDALVQAVDGVLIGGDDEEIKMLFFYIKPGGDVLEDGKIHCKAVVELRVSCSSFEDIAKNIIDKYKSVTRYQSRLEDYMFC